MAPHTIDCFHLSLIIKYDCFNYQTRFLPVYCKLCKFRTFGMHTYQLWHDKTFFGPEAQKLISSSAHVGLLTARIFHRNSFILKSFSAHTSWTQKINVTKHGGSSTLQMKLQDQSRKFFFINILLSCDNLLFAKRRKCQ